MENSSMDFVASERDPSSSNCSFCGKTNTQVVLIMYRKQEDGSIVGICEECVFVCTQTIIERLKEQNTTILGLRIRDKNNMIIR